MKAVWYYQTKDFKFHTIKKVKRIEEIADSENKMKIFFDDKICLGCQLKKDFIEILFGEKQVRVSIDDKDDFIDYTSYSDLVTIFNKNYSEILDAKKCKHIEKSIIDILNMVGLIIVLLGLISGYIFLHINEMNYLAKEKLSAFIIIMGIGLALTFPKNLKDFNENNGSDLVNGKGIIGSLFGLVLIIAGIWLLIR